MTLCTQKKACCIIEIKKLKKKKIRKKGRKKAVERRALLTRVSVGGRGQKGREHRQLCEWEPDILTPPLLTGCGRDRYAQTNVFSTSSTECRVFCDATAEQQILVERSKRPASSLWQLHPWKLKFSPPCEHMHRIWIRRSECPMRFSRDAQCGELRTSVVGPLFLSLCAGRVAWLKHESPTIHTLYYCVIRCVSAWMTHQSFLFL